MSKPHRFGRLAGALVILACSVTAARAQGSVQTGTLASGDKTLESGELYDEYQIEGLPGDEIVAVLTSYDFDPYLILIPPSGDQLDNDDFGGSRDVSLIEVPVDEAVGIWKVRVTTYESEETGDYALMTGTREADGDDAGGEDRPEEFTIRDTISIGDSVDGMLDAEDPMRTVDDSYYEAYVLEASAGTDVVIRLESDDFDPYLVLVAPSGEIEDSNDDAEEGDLNSLLEATLSEGGQWLIVANTLEPGETGAYRLTVSKKVRPR
jgi:hypothetical protein